MTAPFAMYETKGIAWIDRNVDARFRKALMDGAPISLRHLITLALNETPDPANDLCTSQMYFGDRLQEIADRAKPLTDALDAYMATKMALPGFRKWLIYTGYTNNYLMIKVFDAWSGTRKEP